jgi:hypothetical protein
VCSSDLWAPVFLAATVPHTEPGPLTADLRVDGDRIVGDVTGVSPGQGQSLLVCWRGHYYLRGAAGLPWQRATNAQLAGLPIPALAAVASSDTLPPPSALIPQPFLDDEHACLLALAPAGPEPALDVKQPRVTATHLIRQIICLSAKGSTP